jgi:hypothetical protein
VARTGWTTDPLSGPLRPLPGPPRPR